MIEEEIASLYKKTKKQLAALLDDMTFANFYRALQSGKRSYLLKNTKITKGIDEDWVNAIKKTIPHLDIIINDPRKYMKRETDVVPIEKARIVDSESVRHLASHTNLINSVTNGFVRPSKILSAYNEESLELYENRFVATLINRVSQFIDRRYFLLGSGGKEFSSSVEAQGAFEQAGEETEYSVSMTVKQGADYFDGGVSSKVYEDLFLIRKYINSFKYSPFMKIMNTFGQVREPIMNTNLLAKEPNYHACVELWDFIESYNKAGYKIEFEESAPLFARDLVDDFDAINMLQYIALKRKMGDFDVRRRAMHKCDKRVIKPTIEDFNSTQEISLDPGGSGYNGKTYKKDNRDRDNMIKEALLRALRKEAVKQELEAQKKKERDEALSIAIKSAMEQQNEIARQRDRRNKEIENTIKEALRDDAMRAKQQERDELKHAQPALRVMQRYLDKIESDDALRLEQEKREKKENDELMSAVLADLLRIEDERQYTRASPLIIKGGENMPVPIIEERLPAINELSEMYKDMFTPPVRVTNEDWEDFKASRKKKRVRYSEDDLKRAIAKAIELERKRERKEAEQREKEVRESEREKILAERAAEDKQRELDEVNESNNTELNDEHNKISHGQFNQSSKSEIGDEQSSENDENSNSETAKREAAATTDAEEQEPQPSSSGAIMESEERLGFWQRLLRIIFGWWHKK